MLLLLPLLVVVVVVVVVLLLLSVGVLCVQPQVGDASDTPLPNSPVHRTQMSFDAHGSRVTQQRQPAVNVATDTGWCAFLFLFFHLSGLDLSPPEALRRRALCTVYVWRLERAWSVRAWSVRAWSARSRWAWPAE